MTAWTTISNALVAVGAKPFATTMQALRDNVVAAFEGDATAVAAGITLSANAHPQFVVGGVDLINFYGLNIVTTGAIGPAGGGSSATVYADILAFTAARAGTVRVSVELREGNANCTSSILRIYNNATLLSTLTDIDAVFSTYTYDLTWAAGDHIRLESGCGYNSTVGSAIAQFQNLKLLADKRGVFRL